MKLEHILLGVLLEHPSTGYDLKGYLDTRGRFLRSRTQMSQVYRTLTAMEERGWVSHRIEPRPGAQDAKRYQVTEEGETVFLDWLTGAYDPPSRFQDPEFSARLSFAGFLQTEQLLALVDTELAARSIQVARYRFRDRSRHEPAVPTFNAPVAHIVDEWAHEYGSDAMDRHIEALKRLRQMIVTLEEN